MSGQFRPKFRPVLDRVQKQLAGVLLQAHRNPSVHSGQFWRPILTLFRALLGSTTTWPLYSFAFTHTRSTRTAMSGISVARRHTTARKLAHQLLFSPQQLEFLESNIPSYVTFLNQGCMYDADLCLHSLIDTFMTRWPPEPCDHLRVYFHVCFPC